MKEKKEEWIQPDAKGVARTIKAVQDTINETERFHPNSLIGLLSCSVELAILLGMKKPHFLARVSCLWEKLLELNEALERNEDV